MQATFIIAVAFNIKGVFKQRIWSSMYMSLSIVIYEWLLFYLLFLHEISRQFPLLSNINDTINDIFMVARTSDR